MTLLFPVFTWAKSCAIVPGSIVAAKAGNNSNVRPETGWVSVTLPDIWLQRWPGYTGTVWYRMNLDESCQNAQDAALFVERINMAGAVWINQTPLWRDEQLTEPLSRSWNAQRYWQIPAALLQEKNNTVWIQVIGLAFHAPGLGRVQAGNNQAIDVAYTWSIWMNKYAWMINQVISGVVGSICLLIWIMRRREKAFGWYGLMSILWVLFGYNVLATSTWPFSNSLDVSVFNSIAFVLYTACFCIFTWRFGQCHYPKLEKLLFFLTTVSVVFLLVLPKAWQIHMLALSGTIFTLVFFGNCILYQFYAWKVRRTEDTLLAVTLLFYLVIGVHTTLVMLQMIHADFLYVALSGLVGMVFMSLMLAWVFVRNIKKIEYAADDLKITIDETRVQLTDTLQREHALEMQNALLKERLQIARDLHDGFGSSLVRSITLVEQTQAHLERKHYLSILKSIRDDLRQVIDNSGHSSQLVKDTPAQWIVPIRHRFTHIFEELSMQSSWSVAALWPQSWTQAKLIELTRFVEEGLTNVIKHSHASQVWFELHTHKDANDETLSVTIGDDGIGFDAKQITAACIGIGMQSMMARVQKLGGNFKIRSSNEGTILEAHFQFNDQLTESITTHTR